MQSAGSANACFGGWLGVVAIASQNFRQLFRWQRLCMCPNMMDAVVEWAVGIVERLGYWGVAAMMFLENVFPPIPSEAIMPLAGFTAKQGEMSLWLVIAAGTIGSVIGQLPLYYLGYYFDRDRLRRLADRYGKWITVRGKDIDKSAAWFDRHGAKAVLLCRFVPGVRSFISIPAGMARMNLVKFLLYSTLGMGLWAGMLAAAGWLLADQWERVETFIGPVSWVVIGGLVLFVIIWIIRRKRQQRAESLAGHTITT